MSHLELREDGAVATLTIQREDKLNALNAALLAELLAVVTALEARAPDHRPRALILTGAGQRAFAAGADVAELATLSVDAARRHGELGHEAGRAFEHASFPVLAAVNGFALGGGLEMALACDLILAGESARFGQPEVNLGLIPGFGATLRLRERVGIGWARRLLYTGDLLSAAEAANIGLVDAVFPDAELSRGAHELAERIAEKAPLAVGAAKRTLLSALRAGTELAREAETLTFAGLFASEDAGAGMRAFLAKQKARFSGR